MMDYDISFDPNNRNLIIVKKNGKIITMMSCPPTENGCDVIDLFYQMNSSYTYNFQGLVVMTVNRERTIYHKGSIIAKTNNAK